MTSTTPVGAAATFVAAAGVFLAIGSAIGSERVDSIDAGALRPGPGRPGSFAGFVTSPPRFVADGLSFRVEVGGRRAAVSAPADAVVPGVGEGVLITGTARPPPDWQRSYLAVHGIAAVIDAGEVRAAGAPRGGLSGLADSIRRRSADALERGMPAPAAALVKGFVLGDDSEIDGATTEAFRRSGLAHLLAVSGQNVVLLALLALPILVLLGVGSRARLVCILALIAIYVPVTGAGPSIQRAAVMGAAGILALLAGRPRSRWYVLLLSGAATLAWNPRWITDPGWQLSFAATAGIAIGARPVREALIAGGAGSSRPRRAAAEGAAMTVAATIATAPVAALHFGTFSPAALPANLLALPAEAPVMWAGMLIAMLAQMPAVPGPVFDGLGWLAGSLAGYIGLIAERLAAPGWSQVELASPRPAAVAAAALCGAVGLAVATITLRRRAGHRPRAAVGSLARGRWLVAALTLVLAAAALAGAGSGSGSGAAPGGALEVSVLDVGQGDAILLEPARGDPILVDTGPPGAGIAELLRDEGVSRLAAVLITHDQSDHGGGLPEVIGAVEVGAVLTGVPATEPRTLASGAGVPFGRLEAGDSLRAGRLRLEIVWPSRESVTAATSAADPNATSLVAVARAGAFSMLLTGDAEAELAPIDPGPVDVLKVAHHGSADTGLEALLDRSSPRLALISAGADNPFGHPAPATLAALSGAGVPVLRTDLEGEIELRVGWNGSFAVQER